MAYLEEGNIDFAPTYKYKEGSSEIEISKKHVPTYADRILFFQNLDSFYLFEYKSIPQVYFSDHIPVIAKFKVIPLLKDLEEQEKEQLKAQRDHFAN